MIVGFMLAGILAGSVAAALSLMAGYGILAALGFYALSGCLVMIGGAAFLLARGPAPQEALPADA